MAQVAESTGQEYWRPPNVDVARVITILRGACWRCGMDYPPGARFCHVCGSERDARNATAPRKLEMPRKTFSVTSIAIRMGLSLPCLVLFCLGIVFALAAVFTGMIYQQSTLVDWQAVQMWRIEWLLASAAAFLGGILLKKKSA